MCASISSSFEEKLLHGLIRATPAAAVMALLPVAAVPFAENRRAAA